MVRSPPRSRARWPRCDSAAFHDECEATTADLAALVPALASLSEASDDSERIDRIRLFEEIKGAVAAAQARETAAFAASRRAGHSLNGSKAAQVERDIAGQVGLARRISPHAARRYVGFAIILTNELPATFEVLRRGQTSEWRAQLVARQTIWLSRQHRAQVDETIAARLPSLGDKRVDAGTRGLAYQLDPKGFTERLRRAEQDRRVGIRPAPDAMVWLGALLTIPQGVAAYAALGKHADTLRASGNPRSRDQLMADTFADRILGRSSGEVPIELELVMTDEALFGTDATPPTGRRDPAPGATADRPGWSSAEPAWLVGYGPLPADYARNLVLDTSDAARRWIRRLFRAPGTGELVAMDIRRRLFSPAQRHFVRLRDQYCRTSWCEAPIRHTDHVRAYENGGPTSVANAQGTCESCNQTKQSPGWTTAPVANGALEIITPTGHRYLSELPRPPGRTTSRAPNDRRSFGPVEWHFATLIGVVPAAA